MKSALPQDTRIEPKRIGSIDLLLIKIDYSHDSVNDIHRNS